MILEHLEPSKSPARLEPWRFWSTSAQRAHKKSSSWCHWRRRSRA